MKETNFEKKPKTKEDIPHFENVIGLFNLLLKIDMRDNPHLYKNNNQ